MKIYYAFLLAASPLFLTALPAACQTLPPSGQPVPSTRQPVPAIWQPLPGNARVIPGNSFIFKQSFTPAPLNTDLFNAPGGFNAPPSFWNGYPGPAGHYGIHFRPSCQVSISRT
jgi:hypothetical protein